MWSSLTRRWRFARLKQGSAPGKKRWSRRVCSRAKQSLPRVRFDSWRDRVSSCGSAARVAGADRAVAGRDSDRDKVRDKDKDKGRDKAKGRARMARGR